VADGETVDRAPEAVVLVLDERPIAMGLQVVVTGPAGPIQTGSPTRSHFGPARLNAEAPAGSTPSPGGVTSADGDPVTGTFHFTAQAPRNGQAPSKSKEASAPPQSNAAPAPPQTDAPSAPQANPPSAASDGRPQSWLLLLVVLALAAGVGPCLWHRLRRPPGEPSP